MSGEREGEEEPANLTIKEPFVPLRSVEGEGEGELTNGLTKTIRQIEDLTLTKESKIRRSESITLGRREH